MVRVRGIDPHIMEVTVRAAWDLAEARAAVGAHDETAVWLVDAFLVLRIDNEVSEVEWPQDHVLAAIARLPRLAAVVRAIEAVERRHCFDERVNDVWFGWRDCDRDASPRFRRQSLRALVVERGPRRTAIRALEKTTAALLVRTIAARAERPSLSAEVPHARVDGLRRGRIH